MYEPSTTKRASGSRDSKKPASLNGCVTLSTTGRPARAPSCFAHRSRHVVDVHQRVVRRRRHQTPRPRTGGHRRRRRCTCRRGRPPPAARSHRRRCVDGSGPGAGARARDLGRRDPRKTQPISRVDATGRRDDLVEEGVAVVPVRVMARAADPRDPVLGLPFPVFGRSHGIARRQPDEDVDRRRRERERKHKQHDELHYPGLDDRSSCARQRARMQTAALLAGVVAASGAAARGCGGTRRASPDRDSGARRSRGLRVRRPAERPARRSGRPCSAGRRRECGNGSIVLPAVTPAELRVRGRRSSRSGVRARVGRSRRSVPRSRR